jgi:GMP synthase (glutamine-hydrolysing)
MDIQEIKLDDLVEEKFIEEQVAQLKKTVGDGIAINALSGGVDSSVVTLIAHKALGKNLKTYFIENGIMRQGEPEHIVSMFKDMGVPVDLIDAKEQFFGALKGLSDPEEKREAITQTFYKDVFGQLVKDSNAKYLLQGTNYTDVEETVAKIKRQHNILEQLGIDTQKEFGYKVLEPIIQLRKTGVRKVGKALGLPEELYNRPPFPGPALAARIIGEVTPERTELVRKATVIVEDELKDCGAFQWLAVLHNDRVTGMRNNKRDYGFQIEIRCWESTDAVTATPTKLPFENLTKLAKRMTEEVPGVVSVTYNIATKPPSTIEVV